MPKVEKRNDLYTMRLSLTDPLTGKRIQKRISARTKTELRDLAAEIRTKHRRGESVNPDDTPLSEWMESWLLSYRRSEASRFHRERAIKLHIAADPIGDIPIGRLKTAHVQAWVDRKAAEFSANYVRDLVAVLRMGLKRAVRVGIIQSSPCADLDLPATQRTAWRILTQDEVRRLIDGTRDDRYHAMWVLGVTLGIRRGELIALRWSDVDFTRGTIRVERTLTRDAEGEWMVGEVTKTDASARTIRLPDECLAALKRHRVQQNERRLAAGDAWEDSGAIFDRGLGDHWANGTELWRQFVATLARLGLPRIRMHDMRHTAATHMLRAGVPIPTISRILGHADPSITMRVYSHVLDAMEDDAIIRINGMYGPSQAVV